MTFSLYNRLTSLSRLELLAGIGVALILSGLVLRFLGGSILLPTLNLLRSLSDEAITLCLQAAGLVEIGLGLGLLAFVATRSRSDRSPSIDTDNQELEP
jgi:hypothetical protein